VLKRLVPIKGTWRIWLLITLALSLVSAGYYRFSNFRVSTSSVSETVEGIGTSVELATCTPETSRIDYYYYQYAEPLWEPNNKFGLYVYAEKSEFFKRADELINSNGGDWGYVLIPYNVKDRDESKWEKVFDQLREKHLIPVIQLHDVDVKNYKSQTKDAAEFLNSFVWPIRYKYVSVYNEPNDAKFWYGRIDPSEYARILDYTVETFKRENSDFFMMNGAFNVSAASNGTEMDAFQYMKLMDKEVDGIFNKLDGWASHSYPQPNFSGNPNTQGRMGIRAYDAELSFLKSELGLDKELPVFITETGWAHAEGEIHNTSYLPVSKIADYFKQAYYIWLKDPRVRAVMPFTVWYEPPFDHFSWLNRDGVPYEHFIAIKELKKAKGAPPKLESASVQVNNCP
jgi:hypothetical protein